MYVRLFDDPKRGEGDSPTLCIILCTDKDDTLVRYSVLKESQQLFASKYRLILPSEEELRDELERRHILELPNNERSDDESWLLPISNIRQTSCWTKRTRRPTTRPPGFHPLPLGEGRGQGAQPIRETGAGRRSKSRQLGG
jgi:hypothetical protein